MDTNAKTKSLIYMHRRCMSASLIGSKCNDSVTQTVRKMQANQNNGKKGLVKP